MMSLIVVPGYIFVFLEISEQHKNITGTELGGTSITPNVNIFKGVIRKFLLNVIDDFCNAGHCCDSGMVGRLTCDCDALFLGFT